MKRNKDKRQKTIKRLGLIWIALMGCLYTQADNIIDEVVWIVGDEAILRSEVEEERLRAQYEGIEIMGDPYCFIPEQLAIQKLFLHQADLDSIEVSESTVNHQVDMRMNYYISQIGSKEKMEEYFRKSSVDIREEMMTTVKNQMIIQQMQAKLTENIKPTPADIRRYYNSLPEDSIPVIPAQVEVQILSFEPQVPIEETERVKARLREFTERVTSGQADFGMLARLYSEDTESAKRGGELGFVGKGQLVSAFADVAFNLNDPKRVSRIVQTEYGYHIIQLIEKKGDRINCRHILLRPRSSATDKINAISRLDSIKTMITDSTLTFEQAVIHFSQGDDPEPAIFTVTFDSKGGTSLADFNTTVEYGQTIPQPVNKTTGKPVIPTRTGYTFDCWKIGTTETEFVFGDTPITANTVITASWEPKNYALPVVLSENEADLEFVSLSNNKGEELSALKVTYDTRSYLTSPKTTKEGDKFEYWYYKNDKGENVRFTAYADGADQVYQLSNYLFDKAITIYAMWHSHLDDVTLTYDANGGNVTSATGATVKIRDGVEKPLSDPEKAGYAFKYWYYLDDLDHEVEFDFLDKAIENDTYTQVTKDMTVYAKWVRAITISNKDDLDTIRTTIAAGGDEAKEYANAKYTLADNITVENFQPLFTSATHFAGELDGGEHTITINGFEFSDTMSFLGYNDGKVKNLDFVITLNATYPDGNSITKSNIGAVASFNTGDIINVSSTVSGSVSLKDITFGGIVANNAGGELTDVTSHVSFTTFEGLKVSFGGIVGNSTSGPIINAQAEITVKYNSEQALKATSLYVGGIVGQTTGGTISKANVKAFDVNFGASQTAYAGAIAGATQGVKVDQSLIVSSIVCGSANTVYAGGAIGSNGGTLSNCEVDDADVNVTAIGSAYAGGIVGSNANGTGTAKVVYALITSGSVTVTTESGKVFAGGIAGMAENSILSYSYANATVSAYAPATNEGIGNIVGKYSASVSITNVYFGESVVLKLNDEAYDDTAINFPICKTGTENVATNDEITTADWVKSKLGFNPDDNEIWTITDGTTPKLSAFVA